MFDSREREKHWHDRGTSIGCLLYPHPDQGWTYNLFDVRDDALPSWATWPGQGPSFHPLSKCIVLCSFNDCARAKVLTVNIKGLEMQSAKTHTSWGKEMQFLGLEDMLCSANLSEMCLVTEAICHSHSHAAHPQHRKPEHILICCSALDRMFSAPYVLILLRWQRHTCRGSLHHHDFSSFFWLLVQALNKAAGKPFVQCSVAHSLLRWSPVRKEKCAGAGRVVVRFAPDPHSSFHTGLPLVFLPPLSGIPLSVDKTLKLSSPVHLVSKIHLYLFFFICKMSVEPPRQGF